MCGNKRLSNESINSALRDLRVQIREGKVHVQHAFAGNFPRVVSGALGGVEYNSDNFNPQTINRLTVLFNVPQNGDKWPTPDQTAWALQNFINRRSDPWAHITSRLPLRTEENASV